MPEFVFHKKTELVNIDFPGIVKNEEQMLASLGGEKMISQVYNNPTLRLPLKFRPDDHYCKPVFGDRHSSTGMLLKITRKKGKGTNGCVHEQNADWKLKVEVLGIVSTVFRFQGMMDFQYLPMCKQADKTYQPILEELTIRSIRDISALQRDVPLFTPPYVFSRVDLPITDYNFREAQGHRDGKKDPVEDNPGSVISVSRPRRGHNCHYLQYGKPIPSEPLPQATAGNQSSKAKETIKLLKEVFNERPVWSRPAILWKTGISNEILKLTLPVVSYYYSTGPWRACWIRFGYDPSKDPAAKNHQILDFRARADFMKEVKIKRKSIFKQSAHSSRSSQQIGMISTDKLEAVVSSKSIDKPKSEEPEHEFHPERLPSARQSYYHLSDIKMLEAQALIHENDGEEDTCNEKDGWCKDGTMDKLRDLLANAVSKLLKSMEEGKNITETYTQMADDVLADEETEDEGDERSEEEYEGENAEIEMSQQAMSIIGQQSEPLMATLGLRTPSSDEGEENMDIDYG